MPAPITLTRTVTPPSEVPVWDATRRRIDVVRSLTGRVAAVVGTAAAAAVLIHPSLAVAAVTAAGAAVTTAIGAGILRLSAPFMGHQKATATALYCIPGVSLTVLLAGEYAVARTNLPVPAPIEFLAIAVWAGWTFLARPARYARHMVTPRPPAAPASRVAPVEHKHPAAYWWDEHAAVKKGPAAATVLEGIEMTGGGSMTAIIRAAEHGKPVPDISIKHLSALLDVPEDEIAIIPVPGRGAGVRRLTVGTPPTDADSDDPAAVWSERIAPMAMPNAVLTNVRVGRPGRRAEPADLEIGGPDDTDTAVADSDEEDE